MFYGEGSYCGDFYKYDYDVPVSFATKGTILVPINIQRVILLGGTSFDDDNIELSSIVEFQKNNEFEDTIT